MLEKHFKDVQDVEFTIQEGKLFMLQTRNGKRTAACRAQVLHGHGQGEAHRLENRHHAQSGRSARPAARADLRSSPRSRRPRRSPTVCPPVPAPLPGKIYLNADRAVAAAEKGEKVLLVRNETSPEDLRGMIAAEGILTARAASVRTRRSSPARWARSASAAPARCRSITSKDGDGRRPDLQRRRFPLDRRHRRRRLRRASSRRRRPRSSPVLVEGDQGGAEDARSSRAFNQLMEWCAQGDPPAGSHQRRHPEQTGTRSRSAPTASASAAPSTCSSKATASTRCAR